MIYVLARKKLLVMTWKKFHRLNHQDLHGKKSPPVEEKNPEGKVVNSRQNNSADDAEKNLKLRDGKRNLRKNKNFLKKQKNKITSNKIFQKPIWIICLVTMLMKMKNNKKSKTKIILADWCFGHILENFQPED